MPSYRRTGSASYARPPRPLHSRRDDPQHAPYRPPGHGRVLRVGRTAALSRIARPAGRDRRRPRCIAAELRRWHARFRRLRDYAGRGVVTTSTYEARAPRRVLGDGHDEGGATRARRDPAADRLRRLPPLFAPVQGSVADIAPQIEDRGIDEIYIDLTDLPGDARDARRAHRSRRCAKRPACRVRSASHRTSCWRKSVPNSTSPTALRS